MPRQRRTNRYIGRLAVTDFANHNDIRVVAKDVLQTRREGQAPLRIHGHLVDAFKLILNRVFNSYHLDARRIYRL